MSRLRFEYVFSTIMIFAILLTSPFSLGFGWISAGILVGAFFTYFFSNRNKK